MRSEPIYLDHNATTPVLPEVVDAMLPYLREQLGNPSSEHAYGLRARAAVARAREDVAALIGAEPDELVFTSGGTEANNLAIRGAAEALGRVGRVVTSTVEHPATARPCGWLAAHGWRLTELVVDGACRVDLAAAREALAAGADLVTVMHSNNETGTLEPIEELSRLARDAGAVMHTDGAQSVGKVPVDVRELGVDLLSIAGHKLYAPKGIGALYVRRGTPLVPLMLGAGHERGLRPGTENVASIVGLGAACALARRDLLEVARRLGGLREELWARLAAAVSGLQRSGGAAPCLPNTLHVRFPGVSGRRLLAGAPDVAGSTGSACHGGEERASGVLLAMGIEPSDALGAVRLSLGRGTSPAEIARAADALVGSYRALVAG